VLTRLEQSVKRAHNTYTKVEAAARERQHPERTPVQTEPDDSAGELDEQLDDAA